jgi:hypothetical protein
MGQSIYKTVDDQDEEVKAAPYFVTQVFLGLSSSNIRWKHGFPFNENPVKYSVLKDNIDSKTAVRKIVPTGPTHN